MTGREVLANMLEAYRNASSYSDMGTARISITVEGQGKASQPKRTKPSSPLAFVRPNKVRIQAYEAEVICDGTEAVRLRAISARSSPGSSGARANDD